MTYALTCAEYWRLVDWSEGRCDRCAVDLRVPKIDHNHAIGRRAVRGMLCHSCNLVVATVERGHRPLDELTRQYLARPFHDYLDLSDVAAWDTYPGYRPRPKRDQHITRKTPGLALVSLAKAAEIIGVDLDEALQMMRTGELVGSGHESSWVVRRVVAENLREFRSLTRR